MHFVKLFLAGSFAAAAAIRSSVSLFSGAFGGADERLVVLMSGQGGLILETSISLIIGAALAARIASRKVAKAPQGE
jgi:hypothetical protein